jgi:glycosyltransferase involved in cell wall biosynthesis
MTPSVSVIISTYNYGRFLSAALDSVLDQTYPDFEVIVVDDDSTDDTPWIMDEYQVDPRVRYERIAHRGSPVAKNTGIHLAQAPLIAFLDADDIWLPDKLDRQVAIMNGNPKVGVVYSRRLLINDVGCELEAEPQKLYRGQVLAPLFRDNFVCFSSALVRRRVFDHVGFLDGSLPLAADYDFWLRAALHYTFDFDECPLVKYRTGHASLSRRVEERLILVDRITTRFLNEYGGRAALPPGVIRRSQADTYYHLGLYRRCRSRLGALPWYVRCLALAPGHTLAWRGLASLALPEAWRRKLRVACGRSPDWTVRQPAANHEKDFATPQGRSIPSCPPAA